MLMSRCERGLAVSLPGSAVLGLGLFGSVFGPQELQGIVLPPDLRVATNLLVDAAAAAQRPLRFIARPEMFTHGELGERLAAELGGIGDHLALSDGSSCRLVPGLRNHLFFYRRTVPAAVAAMRGLVATAPETFCALDSQVNSTLAFRLDGVWRRPPVEMLRFAETPRTQASLWLPFFMHPGNPERSAQVSLAAAETDEDEEARRVPAGTPVLYVPLSGLVLDDRVFLRWLAERLLAAMLRGRQRIVLELPPSSGDDEEVAEQIAAVIRALAPIGVVFPRVLSHRVAWSTAVPAPERLAGARILVHPGLDFWRFGEDTWRVADEVLAVQPTTAWAGFTAMLRGWLADLAPVRVVRPEPPGHRVRVATGI